jgi:23S rRNA (guanosine2251-2'-O)-methyltransferase
MASEGIKTVRSKTGVRQLYKEFKAQQPKVELAFFLQDWEDPYNVGGMFRVADGCGAAELVMSGRTPVPPHPQISVTSLGQHRRIPYRHFERHEEAALALKEEGYHLVAVEIAEGAVSYREYPYPDKLCLILGNEVNGVYTSVMRHRDGAVFIPMFGKGRSLNVHVAAAIVGFEALLGRSGQPPQ